MYDPPTFYTDSRPELIVTRNETMFDYLRAWAYQNACNLDVFGPAAPYCARIRMRGHKKVDIGVSYYQVTYSVEFRKESFWDYALDRGCRDIDRKLFTDPQTGIPLAEATLLNGNGYSWLKATANLASDIGRGDTTISLTDRVHAVDFPPLARFGAALVRPPHWYFEIRIDDEVMQVQDTSDNGGTWYVVRGFAGTAPANHNANAKITLEPYHLRFLPARVMAFAPLNLPLQ